MCCHRVVVIATAQFHSTKPELRFCAGLAQLEIRLNAFLSVNHTTKTIHHHHTKGNLSDYLYHQNSKLINTYWYKYIRMNEYKYSLTN